MRRAVVVRALPVVLAVALSGLAVSAPVVSAQATASHGADDRSYVEFWQVVGDATLPRLVAEALAGNPEVRAAEARVRGARAERTGAALDMAPIVTLGSGYSRQRLPNVAVPGAPGPLPDQDVWDAGVELAWEVDAFGRRRRTLQGRNAWLASAEEDVRDVRLILAAEVARGYFELRGAQDRLGVARRNAENQRRSLEVTTARLEAGRGTALDTERAQAQLSSTLADIPALEAAITAAQHRLAVLLGRSPRAVELELGNPQDVLFALPDLTVSATPDEIVRERPDVRSAERRVAAQGAFAAAARAEFLPRISIGGMAGYTASAFESLGNTGTPRFAIGPVISWPLLDLGRVKSRVDAARAGEAEAAARYRTAVLRAAEEIETSTVAYTRALERLAHLEEAAAASERATELARLRFEEGATGFLEVLDAERTQLEAQHRLALGRTDAATGLVTLYRALGGRGVAAAATGSSSDGIE